jgi:hypothetical protein
MMPLVNNGDNIAVNQIIASVVPVTTGLHCDKSASESHYIQLLSSTSLSKRYMAAKALAFFDSPEVSDSLVNKLDDPGEHIYVRLETAASLAHLDDKRGYDFIEACLSDEYLQNRLEAVIVLGEIAKDASCQLLIDTVLDNEQHPEIRAGAAWALGERRDKGALDALIESFTAVDDQLDLQTGGILMISLPKPLYTTHYGAAYLGDALDLLKSLPDGSIDLVLTSPPFALLRQKEYGNVDQDEYVDWLLSFTIEVKRVLKETGSFVLDLGGAYRRERPVRSLYNYRILIRLCDEQGWNLAEEFFWFNPSKLPSPIEWVNKRKIRAKDAVNTIWWLAKTDFPKADVTQVLVPYSERMKLLLQNSEKYYSPKKRPSGHTRQDFRRNSRNSL